MRRDVGKVRGEVGGVKKCGSVWGKCGKVLGCGVSERDVEGGTGGVGKCRGR